MDDRTLSRISSIDDPIDDPIDPSDITPPSLTITAPAAGAEVTETSVLVTGTATDPKGSMVSAYVSGVEGVFWAVYENTGTEGTDPMVATGAATALTPHYATWSARVQLPAYVSPKGKSYTIKVSCVDRLGNSTTKSVTITARDRTAPWIAITEPAAGYVITDTNFEVHGTADDGDGQKLQSGIDRIECVINGQIFYAKPKATDDWSTWTALVKVPAAVAAASVSADLGPSYTLTAVVFDKGGLPSLPATATYKARDITPPQLEVSQPARGTSIAGGEAGATVTFQGTVNDGYGGAKLTSGVQKVECLFTDKTVTPNVTRTVQATLQALPGGGMTWSAAVALPSLGTHTVTLRWSDHAGNTSTSDHSVSVVRPQSQNKGVMTPMSYLADLLDYVTRRVKTGTSVPVNQAAITNGFLQSFEVTPEPVHQIRIAVEVLRRWLRPMAHWRLDDATGTTARDAGRAGNDGTLQGGPSWVGAGRIGGALAFDGVDDRIAVSADAGLKALVNTFTIAFWAKPQAAHRIDVPATSGTSGTSGQRYVIGPESGSAYGLPDDHAGAGVSVGTNGVSVYEHSDGYLPALLVHQQALSGWTHVAVVYANGLPSLYVNGTFVTQGLRSPKAFVHARPVSIGGMGDGFYQGQLDDVRIYDRALSAESIAALAAATTTAAEPVPSATLEGEAAYRQAAYLALLTRLGTSFEGLRQARTAPDDVRRALAARLGMALPETAATPRHDQLDQMLLDPATVSEADLERVFGLASTTTSGPPLAVAPLDASLVLRWQRDRLSADWQAADAAAGMPVIDPDLIGVADMASAHKGNTAFDLWTERRTWVEAELKAIRASRASQSTSLAGLDRVLVETWGPAAVTDLQAIDADRTAGRPVDAALAAKQLDLRAFVQLMRLRTLAAQPGTMILASEWEEAYSILVQARKRQRTAVWKEEERQRNVTLRDELFVVAGRTGAPAPLPRWRATAEARQQWQDTLQARIDQDRAVRDALRAAIDATEEATLPILRDALVRAVGTDADLGDRLTKRLLLDVRDSGFRQITRVDQAIATLQELLFSLRTGRAREQDAVLGWNPAAGWSLVGTEQSFDREWSWMGTFATWRAAMFVYQYPENVLYPNLRSAERMTPPFREFLDQLGARGRLTPGDARAIAADYVSALTRYGMTARWLFDEGSGATAADATGTGNTATLGTGENAPTWIAGRQGRGLAFDGKDDLVEVPHTPSLDVGKGNADFAVSFWIYLREGPLESKPWRVLMRKGNDPDKERTFALWLHPDRNTVHFRISTNNFPNEGGDSVEEIKLKKWTHVVYAKMGKTLRLFINGEPKGDAALVGDVKTNTSPLRLGWDRAFPATCDMILDDVRIYNPSFVAVGAPATPGTAAFPLAGDVLYELESLVLTEEQTAEGLLEHQKLSRRLLAPWLDRATGAMRPDAPPYLEELFFFVPLQLALQLQRSGQHLAALDWFQTIYAYDLPVAQRKIYHGLEAEGKVVTSFDSGSDLWLPADLNPHVVAARRAGAYTRFTLLALVRCFLEFADVEYTRDTPESLPRARTLYLGALDLLALDEMKPVAAAAASGVVPPNPAVEALRLHAQLNLAKMRQGRNIAGMQRQHAPEPPVTAPTGAATLPAARPTLALRPTPYYYSVLIERAKQLVGIAQQVEAAYLAALEKRDGEAYNLLKANQDISLAKASVELQALRVVEADRGVELASRQRARVTIQVTEYGKWISAGPSYLEKAVISDYRTAAKFRRQAAMIDAAITAVSGVTSISGAILAAASIAGSDLTLSSEEASTRAQIASIQASQERRKQEWQLQLDLANQDAAIADQQISIASGQLDIAKKEQAIAAIETNNAQIAVDFLANKFTNVELYEWMSGVLGGVYAYFLQQAAAMAQLAQMQLAFERQETPPGFIQVDYWEAPSDGRAPGASAPDRRGLTGSARLLQDIHQLDQFAFDTNKRKLQLTHTLSLASLAPAELQRFRETGEIVFATPMALFDQAFPGHYLRLIRRVRTSVVALIPPSQGIRASLLASGVSRVVIKTNEAYNPVVVRRDPELVALTSPSNATGLFELDVQSEMLLPFEGMGVDTTWELRMPKAANPFDYRTIADVLLSIEYTALHSFDYREQVIRSLPTRTSADRAISMRRQFADQWYDLHNPAQSINPMTIRFSLDRDDFPPNLSALRIQHLLLHFARVDGTTEEITVADFRSPETPVGPARSAVTSDGTISTRRGGGASWAPLLGGSPVGVWVLRLSDDAATRDLFARGAIEEILLVVTYSGELPAWV